MKSIIIAGASGMVGSVVLKECLQSSEVGEVVSLVRKKSGIEHEKLEEVIVSDFSDYGEQSEYFKNKDAAFFCIGVYTGQVPDDLFKVITVDFAVAFAEILHQESPAANLSFLSGAGADRNEKSKLPFALYKGMAENQIAAMGLKGFYVFRPGYIYPVKPREEPNLMYKLSRTFYPVIKLFGKKASIKSTELGEAMFYVAMNGGELEIFENRDILEVKVL